MYLSASDVPGRNNATAVGVDSPMYGGEGVFFLSVYFASMLFFVLHVLVCVGCILLCTILFFVFFHIFRSFFSCPVHACMCYFAVGGYAAFWGVVFILAHFLWFCLCCLLCSVVDFARIAAFSQAFNVAGFATGRKGMDLFSSDGGRLVSAMNTGLMFFSSSKHHFLIMCGRGMCGFMTGEVALFDIMQYFAPSPVVACRCLIHTWLLLLLFSRELLGII